MVYNKKTRKEHFLKMIDNSGVDLNETTRLELLNDMEEFLKELKTKIPCKDTNRVKVLEQHWYDSLPSPDIGYYYGSEDYFIDVFVCWLQYSRMYIKRISKLLKEHPTLVPNIDTIVDLGCGPGFTTDYLSKEIVAKRVVGTNLKNTWQWNHANNIGLTVVESIKEVDTRIDLVVAFEYFEHVCDPIKELIDLIDSSNPKCIIVRNGFNGRAIGHFLEYPVNNTKVSHRKMGRIFNQTMRAYGYTSTKHFFNDEPKVWIRK